MQAIHDMFFYADNLAKYDHFEFPGVVPRSFVGALVVAIMEYPAKLFLSTFSVKDDLQLISRAVVGAVNAFMLIEFRRKIEKVFGNRVSAWFMLITISQFHLIYYASRTLPNMMAMPLVLFAFGQFLDNNIGGAVGVLSFTAIVLRAELILLAASLGIISLGARKISLSNLIISGMRGVGFGVIISITVDSYFWDQFPIIPEVNSFFFNVVAGKSSEWGVEPFLSYFQVHLPNLTNNPTILALIPMGLFFHKQPADETDTENENASTTNDGVLIKMRILFASALMYMLVYSFQPHKELRFIIYVLPIISLAAANGACAAWELRSRNLGFRILSIGAMFTSVCAIGVSLLKLLVSRMNYPGGEALQEFHNILENQEITYDQSIVVHMDVPVCMTGATRFLQRYDDAYFLEDKPFDVVYDKTEDRAVLAEKWPTYDFLIGTVDSDKYPIPCPDHHHWVKRSTIESYAGISKIKVLEMVNSVRYHPEGPVTAVINALRLLQNAFIEDSFFGVFEYIKASVWDQIILTQPTAYIYEKLHD